MSPLKRQSACHHVIVTLNTRKGWWPYLRCLLVATPCSAFVPSSGANNRRKDGAIFNSSNVLDKATSKRMELLFASAATTTAVVSNGSTARLQLPSSCATGGPGPGNLSGLRYRVRQFTGNLKSKTSAPERSCRASAASGSA